MTSETHRRPLPSVARFPGKLGLAAVVAATTAIALPAAASTDILEGTVADGLGIAAHAPSDDDLSLIRGLGFSIVRTDLSWARTEKTRGVYDFTAALELARSMHERGLRPMLILDYGNQIYSPLIELNRRGHIEKRAAAPDTSEAVQAFADWATAAVKAFAPYDPIWEVWNEPDQARFWPPEPDPAAYARLAGTTCEAMRAASPTPLTIVGPAASKWIDSSWLLQVLRSDAVGCFDAVSVHPYQVTANDDEDKVKWGGLRKAIDAAQPGRAMPIANTEWGRSQFNKVTEDQQAAYVVRSLVTNQAAGVGLNVWYVWADKGNDPKNDQDHFGLKKVDGSFRTSRAAVQTLVQQIGDARFRCISYEGGLVTAEFAEQDPAAQRTLVVWSPGGSRTWTPPASARAQTVISMVGDTLAPSKIALASRTPVYVKIDPTGSSPACVE